MKGFAHLVLIVLPILLILGNSGQHNLQAAPIEIKSFEDAELSVPKSTTQPQKNEAEFRFLQENNRLYLIFSVMGVTPLFLIIILFFISRSKLYSAESIVHGSGLVLVIQATLLVVIAAPTTEQLTAAIGVIGAIAGYLFGSTKGSLKSGLDQDSSPNLKPDKLS